MFGIIDELMRMFSGKSYRGKKRLRNKEYLNASKDDYFIDESIVILIDEVQFKQNNYSHFKNRNIRKRFINRRRV